MVVLWEVGWLRLRLVDWGAVRVTSHHHFISEHPQHSTPGPLAPAPFACRDPRPSSSRRWIPRTMGWIHGIARRIAWDRPRKSSAAHRMRTCI